MNNIVKKQGLGTWISLGIVVFSLIGLVLYGAVLSLGNELPTANGGQEFLLASDPAFATVTAAGVVGLLLLVCAIILGQFKFNGIVGKIVDFVVGAVRIIVPALFMLTLLYFLFGTLTGLGWTYFSDEGLEINPDAIKAGAMTITALIFFAISCIAGIVAVFFGITKKEKNA